MLLHVVYILVIKGAKKAFREISESPKASMNFQLLNNRNNSAETNGSDYLNPYQ